MYPRRGRRGRGGGEGGEGGLGGSQRQVANERERKRMQTIGQAFEQLKKCIPWIPADTKLSKADTLRLAVLYIDYLSHILRQDLPAAELTAAVAMQKWPWQKTAFLYDNLKAESEAPVPHVPLSSLSAHHAPPPGALPAHALRPPAAPYRPSVGAYAHAKALDALPHRPDVKALPAPPKRKLQGDEEGGSPAAKKPKALPCPPAKPHKPPPQPKPQPPGFAKTLPPTFAKPLPPNFAKPLPPLMATFYPLVPQSLLPFSSRPRIPYPPPPSMAGQPPKGGPRALVEYFPDASCRVLGREAKPRMTQLAKPQTHQAPWLPTFPQPPMSQPQPPRPHCQTDPTPLMSEAQVAELLAFELPRLRPPPPYRSPHGPPKPHCARGGIVGAL